MLNKTLTPLCTLAALLCLAAAGARAAHAQAAGAPRAQAERAAVLRALVEIEERLLLHGREAYAAAREQERAAFADLEQATLEQDAELAGPESELPRLEALEVERLVARATADIVAGRAGQLRQSLIEGARRLSVLREELGRLAGTTFLGDPISGRWSVTIAAPRQSGSFVLALDGTVVAGSYEMDGGRRGSVRGTYVGGVLRLERIDTERGLDGVLEGTVEEGLGLVRGFFSPTLLSEGGPGGAGWTGVRLASQPAAEAAGDGGGEADAAESEQGRERR